MSDFNQVPGHLNLDQTPVSVPADTPADRPADLVVTDPAIVVAGAITILRETIEGIAYPGSVADTAAKRDNARNALAALLSELADLRAAKIEAHNTCGTCDSMSGTDGCCEECTEFRCEAGMVFAEDRDAEFAEAEKLRAVVERLTAELAEAKR